ncbi:hypothetical protein D3C78_1877330 [compost metagenome]
MFQIELQTAHLYERLTIRAIAEYIHLLISSSAEKIESKQQEKVDKFAKRRELQDIQKSRKVRS